MSLNSFWNNTVIDEKFKYNKSGITSWREKENTVQSLSDGSFTVVKHREMLIARCAYSSCSWKQKMYQTTRQNIFWMQITFLHNFQHLLLKTTHYWLFFKTMFLQKILMPPIFRSTCSWKALKKESVRKNTLLDYLKWYILRSGHFLSPFWRSYQTSLGKSV